MCLWPRLGWRGGSTKEKEEQLELQDNVGTRTKGHELAGKKIKVEISLLLVKEENGHGEKNHHLTRLGRR